MTSAGGDPGDRGDCNGGLQGKAASEDRQPAEHNALRLGEQLVAPVERRAQCLVPRQCRPMAPGEQTEPIVQPRCNFLYPKRRATGRRQFDSQRDTVETTADCRR